MTKHEMINELIVKTMEALHAQIADEAEYILANDYDVEDDELIFEIVNAVVDNVEVIGDNYDY